MSEINISLAAANFLSENLPLQEIASPQNHTIEWFRQQARDGSKEGFDFAKSQYVKSMKDIKLGGIPCLKVTPGSVNPDRSDCIVLYLFGGGYISGGPEEDLSISAFVADRLGVDVVCPRYRLAPEYPFPAARDDVWVVYRELLRVYDSKNIAVVGESAGGHLSLQLILRAISSKVSLPAACALMSPWADLSTNGDSLGFNNGRDPTLSTPWVEAAAEMFVPGADLCSAEVSPLFAEYTSDFPTTFISTGTRDLLLSNSVSLAAKMVSANVDVTLRVWEQMWHVFEYYSHLPEAKDSLEEISDFLEVTLFPELNQ